MPMTAQEKKEYDARHYRMKRVRGRAALHPCVKCSGNGIEKPAREWAWIHDTDGEDPWADYLPLCARCHRRYDRNGHWGPHSEESRHKMSEGHKLAYANGKQPSRWRKDITHCPAEHEYTPENTYIRDNGHRGCNECRREAVRRSRTRRKARQQTS